MRVRAIQIMAELVDAYTSVPPRHKEYITSHIDEIADAALVAHCDMNAMQTLSEEVVKRMASMTPEEIEVRNSILRKLAKDMKE
jgi:hypothetical protein